MTIEDMRWKIMKAYPGTDWIADCEGMSDLQVQNTYRRCLKLGKIEK